MKRDSRSVPLPHLMFPLTDLILLSEQQMEGPCGKQVREMIHGGGAERFWPPVPHAGSHF
jgi:hypothetical protein